MPVWQNINLKQKAIFEIIQKPHARDLPYYLTDDELDFFVKGIAWGPHRETYLPRLVERHKRPIYIARGYAPPTYSRLVMLRYYGPDPLLEGHTGWDAGEEGEIMQYVLGWRWLYADWPGPLVDEVEDILPGTVFCPFDVCFFSHARTRLNCRSPKSGSLEEELVARNCGTRMDLGGSSLLCATLSPPRGQAIHSR